jgi:hypothetical protein
MARAVTRWQVQEHDQALFDFNLALGERLGVGEFSLGQGDLLAFGHEKRPGNL